MKSNEKTGESELARRSRALRSITEAFSAGDTGRAASELRELLDGWRELRTRSDLAIIQVRIDAARASITEAFLAGDTVRASSELSDLRELERQQDDALEALRHDVDWAERADRSARG